MPLRNIKKKIAARLNDHRRFPEYFTSSLIIPKNRWVIWTYLTAAILPKLNSIPFSWAMKMAATASYSAVPSMLIVAPMGITNRDTRTSILLFSSKQAIEIGNDAELKHTNRVQVQGLQKRSIECSVFLFLGSLLPHFKNKVLCIRKIILE